MYEVKGLLDFGTWLRKGKICFCNDSLVIELMKKGYLKVLKYHLTPSGKRWSMTTTLSNLKKQRHIIDLKIKAYEEYFKSKVKK